MTDALPTVIAQRTTAEGVELEFVVSPALPWFAGHFPGFPILPGVVQIDWALDFARIHLGLEIAIARRYRIKFKSAIFPDDRLTLVLSHQAEKRQLAFAYRRGTAVCASGQVTLP